MAANPGILATNITYCKILLEYVNQSQLNVQYKGLPALALEPGLNLDCKRPHYTHY